MNDVKHPWTKKVWGSVWHVFASPHAAVSHLRLDAGFRCSRHWHESRVNQFNVLSGKILVEMWLCGTGLAPYFTWLGPGESLTVPAYEVHRFTVLEPGEVVEVYWPATEADEVLADDIVRLDEGGPVEGGK